MRTSIFVNESAPANEKLDSALKEVEDLNRTLAIERSQNEQKVNLNIILEKFLEIISLLNKLPEKRSLLPLLLSLALKFHLNPESR